MQIFEMPSEVFVCDFAHPLALPRVYELLALRIHYCNVSMVSFLVNGDRVPHLQS